MEYVGILKVNNKILLIILVNYYLLPVNPILNEVKFDSSWDFLSLSVENNDLILLNVQNYYFTPQTLVTVPTCFKRYLEQWIYIQVLHLVNHILVNPIVTIFYPQSREPVGPVVAVLKLARLLLKKLLRQCVIFIRLMITIWVDVILFSVFEKLLPERRGCRLCLKH